MALFSISNDWDPNKTGDELCETFLKDGNLHKKKHHRRKDKQKTRPTSSNNNKNSLVHKIVSNKKSQPVDNRDSKSVNKKLKHKKPLKHIKKKIKDFKLLVSGQIEEKLPLNTESSKLHLSGRSNCIEENKNKNGLKRQRTLSLTIDDDVKPLLKKIKKEKNSRLPNDSPPKLIEPILKKKKQEKQKQNKGTSQLPSRDDGSDKIKDGLKNVKSERILDNAKDIKGISGKLKNMKNKRHKTPDEDNGTERPLLENGIDPIQLKKRKKQLKKLQDLILQNKEDKSLILAKKEPVLTLRQKMMQKLKAARFRFLNEQIYTATSKETQKIFKSDPEAFKAYHEGYRQQVKRWPLNPLDRIIKSVNKMPKTHVIADFGCGEAKLAKSVEQKVYSFDLVAANDTVTACDMTHVPLPESSVDVTVFCLSLMGTNLKDYLIEANRVLKIGGLLKIAEVESRFDDIKTFTNDCEQFGFKKIWMDLSHNLFYFIDFRKESSIKGKKKLPSVTLQPCLYKKR